MTTPRTHPTRFPPLGPLFTGSHRSHPMHPPTLTSYAVKRSFTDPSLSPSHVHTSTNTPYYMRPATQHLTHTDTMRLRSSQSGLPHSDLFLNDTIINHTLQILHHHYPVHYIPTPSFNALIMTPPSPDSIDDSLRTRTDSASIVPFC